MRRTNPTPNPKRRAARLFLTPLLILSLGGCASAQTEPDNQAGSAQTQREQAPVPGEPKRMPESDATRDADGFGQMFEAVHAPTFTTMREGLNGWAFRDFDGNGFLDIVAVTTPPFALDESWDDRTGNVERTRDPRDSLHLFLNDGGFSFRDHRFTISGSPASPTDFGQGWRGSQVPAVADFNHDGIFDIFVSRQAPIVRGEMREGLEPIGSSLLLGREGYDRFEDVSKQYEPYHLLAYNRQISLGDVDRDGFLDIAQGSDNIVMAYDGYPLSDIFLFRPGAEGFADGRFLPISETGLIEDFGGFRNDPSYDKAGPNIILRDLDNDGDLDLVQGYHVLLVPHVPATVPYSPAEYRHGFFNWRNLLEETGEFRFEKVTDNGFADVGQLRYDHELERLVPVSEELQAPAMTHLSLGDVNNDGLFDILAVGTDYGLHRPMSELTSARFWYNRGDFQFQEATVASGLDALHKSYREWHDFFDAELSAEASRFDLSRTRINRVQSGFEAGPVVDASPRYSDAVFADFDNDGWLDLVVVDRYVTQRFETRTLLFMNRGDGTFEPQPTSFSGLNKTGLAVEAADLNNDGLVDLLISSDPDNTGAAVDARQYESAVFMNTGRFGGRDNHWLRLRFSGTTDAELIGARVEVRRPGEAELFAMRGIYSNHSYRSSTALEAHFGLGGLGVVDLEIHLPDGRLISFAEVAADRFLELDLSKQAMTQLPTIDPPSIQDVSDQQSE